MVNKKRIAIIIASILIVVAIFAFYMITQNDRNSTETSKTCTTYSNTVEEQCAEDYIGLSQEDAIEKAEQYKYIPKVVSIDGVEQIVDDIGGAIIYLEIADGFVAGGYFEEGRESGL